MRTPRTHYRLTKAMLAVFIMGTVASLITALPESAFAANVWAGRAEKHGYFSNHEGGSDSPYTCSAHYAAGPVVDNGCYDHWSIPDSVDSKSEIQSWLKSTYGDSKWKSTGVSFIVNTLLGRQANNVGEDKDRSLDNSEWNELAQKLSNPQVTVQDENVTSASYGNVDTYYQYKLNDVAWYKDSESGKALVFRYKGKAVYVLLHKCANPIGDLDGLPDYTPNDGGNPGGGNPGGGGGTPASWTITPTTSASLNGYTITWTHNAGNDGPNNLDAPVTYRAVGDGIAGNTGPSQTLASGRAPGGGTPFTSSLTVNPATDGGKTFCRATTATPGAKGSTASVTSPNACVTIALDYTLHPLATFNDGGTTAQIEPGQTGLQVTYAVRNAGPTGSGPTTYRLTRCVYGSGAPTGQPERDSGSDAAGTFGGSCSTVAGAPGQLYNVSTSSYGQVTETDANLNAGTTVCYIMSVTPPASGIGGWRHSPPACIKVLKTPKVQVLGGDIRAGSVTSAAPKSLGGKMYGSWAEYGIFGIGGISGMGSASSLAGGASSLPTARLSALTFANTGNGGCALGCFYSQAPVQSDFAAYSAVAGPTVSGAGGPVANGTREVRHVSGNLTISSDITYSESYADPSQVPRVIYVVDGDITVADTVTRIDAWLIATGTLYTCASFTNPSAQKLTTGTCSQQLTFNGPVTVGKTVLGRTFGADASPASRPLAGEIFNLAPSNYLSGYAAGQSQSNIQTVYEKELPPRY